MPRKTSLDANKLLGYHDPREMPIYSISEAAHYLAIPSATLRSWVLGTTYTTRSGDKRRFHRVIVLPLRDTNLLSFFNLVEAHVLRAIRTRHGITLRHIRRALNYVKRRFGWKRPLIEPGFQTDGVGLLVEHLGQLIDVASDGQLVMRQVVEAHLQRLEWEGSVVARLYPFTRLDRTAGPRTVMIDPRFSFGRPVLSESRIETAIIAERYKAGDSIDCLAEDYGAAKK
jgi:uncharacterized protein (DUF433 family)